MTDHSVRPFLLHSLATALAAILVAGLALSIFRVLIWADYHPDQPLPDADLAQAFWMGARFDLKAVATLSLLMLVLCTPTVALARWRPFAVLSRVLRDGLLLLMLAFLNLFALINHYYIDFYGSEINSLIFGFFEDDTADVLVSVWNDYPLLQLTLAWIVLTGLQYLVVAAAAIRITQWISRRNPVFRLSFVLAAVLLILLFGRGSLGHVPLRDRHMVVSKDDFINMLVPNGPYAFKYAIQDRRADRIRRNPAAGIDRYGFENLEDAATAYGLSYRSDEALLAALYDTTPAHAWLQKNPPHVVVGLMEAFGRHILDYQSPDNDVLARFAPHMRQDYVFRNAVSINHGTHPTLEGLLFNTPITPLTRAHHHRLASSAVLPYKRAGYRTVFLSSGPANWRRLDGTLRIQGFGEVIDGGMIKKHYPGIPESTWGVPDEYMFRYALELLQQTDREGQPLFLFMLSTSNHTPYEIPPGFRHRPLNPAAFHGLRLSRHTHLLEVLQAYQYAADMLGGFLDQLKSSPLATHTVVTATGDHSTRHFVDYDSDYELLLEYGVPIYFYVPPAYRLRLHYDPQRFGGHRDLFPTLYRLSLSEACFFVSGNDLFSHNSPQTALAGFEHALTAEGSVSGLQRETPVYRRWTTPYQRLDETPLEQPPAHLRDVGLRERGYAALLDWHIRSLIINEALNDLPCSATPATN